MAAKNLINRFSYAIYDFLGRGQISEKADCIFVYAGRPERKIYALQLFQRGYARRVIFSVGRFEWRAFPRLGLEQDGGLAELVQKTPPIKRHFFVVVDELETRCFLIPKGKLGTLSETLALAEFVRQHDIWCLMVVSSSFHLRRTCGALRRLQGRKGLKLIPVAVPEEIASDRRAQWWSNPIVFSLIRKEYLKLLLYWVVVPFHRLMRRRRNVLSFMPDAAISIPSTASNQPESPERCSGNP